MLVRLLQPRYKTQAAKKAEQEGFDFTLHAKWSMKNLRQASKSNGVLASLRVIGVEGSQACITLPFSQGYGTGMRTKKRMGGDKGHRDIIDNRFTIVLRRYY